MPQRTSIANMLAAALWLSVLVLVVGLLFFLDIDPKPRQFRIPFVFWTFYGALLVVITACAIALPASKAVFCRALLLSQLALTIQTNHYWGTVFERLVAHLPRNQLPAIFPLWSSEWFRLAIAGLTYLMIGLFCATIAWAIVRRWPEATRERYQFRLVHLFALSAFVAATLAGIRADNQLATDLAIYVSAVLRLVAVVLAVTNRPAAIFCWGYLAGDFAWCLLVDVHALEVEWDGFLSEALRPYPRAHLLMRWVLPMYAGVVTGVLSALLYQPQLPIEKAAR